MTDDWKHIDQIDFTKEDLKQIHVDTRDFHAALSNEDRSFDESKIKKYGSDFYFTNEELKQLLNRLYTESGGPGKWRFFSFDRDGARNWELKYIRCYKKENGWIICSRNSEIDRAYNKEFWSSPVNTDQNILSHH